VQTYTRIQPDETIYEQYVGYLAASLTGDLGQSIQFNRSVTSVIIEALPWTLFVMGIATVFTFGIAIVLGAILGYKEGTKFDSFVSVTAIVVSSVPYYVAALFFLWILAYRWELFPTGGRFDTATIEAGFNLPFFLDAFHHAILPSASFVITVAGIQAIIMRGNCIQIMGKDYLRVAELRGLDERIIALRYVGRNAVLPMYTEFMISIGFMLGGSIILEQIFAYPGIGFYMLAAIDARDYPLMMGAFIVITVAVVVAVFIADMTYGWIDPRVREGEQQ
jgi:peptide/nickel transport system permease protein